MIVCSVYSGLNKLPSMAIVLFRRPVSCGNARDTGVRLTHSIVITVRRELVTVLTRACGKRRRASGPFPLSVLSGRATSGGDLRAESQHTVSDHNQQYLIQV